MNQHGFRSKKPLDSLFKMADLIVLFQFLFIFKRSGV